MSERLIVVAVGKLRGGGLRELADDYLARLSRLCPTREIEVRSAEALLGAIPRGALLVALEVGGRSYTSTAFSRRLEGWLATGKGRVAFAIGGADGLPRALLDRADEKLSLSSMTLPHRLARVLLLEQLYRATSIARGEPYARE